MDDKEVKFLPFNAINEFMLPAYRLEVLQTVLGADALLVSRGRAINDLIKRYATIQGFRNCLAAPMPLKIKACVSVFEQHADFDALILQSWSDLKLDLRQSMYDHLKQRGWEVLPPDTDRTKLPGFMLAWPKEDEFEALSARFKEAHADLAASNDDICLMAVWIGNRLPVELK
jgi:hypothetical protein